MVMGVVILLLGIKAINSWVFVRQSETMFRYVETVHRYGQGECKMKWNNRIVCEFKPLTK